MIHLYNTLTRKKELFTPLKKGVVSMYHCGPTVYDSAHIGNLRAYVTADILRRTMEYNGLEVKQIMNVTDVDDKTIKKSHEEKVSLQELTEKYTNLFLDDIDILNVARPHVLTRATAHIRAMVRMIERLKERGHAYTMEDGSTYFDVSSFPSYGALAQIDIQKNPTRGRISSDEYEKEDIRDFALWKAWSKEDDSVYWETSLGKGRPGWHIECSVMSMVQLGETFDIHTGGTDLIFPHHTNEIAQSESSTGKQFVHFWLHNEFITVDGKKMAKSEGNIITLNDIVGKGFNPLAYRYWLLTAHYRTLVNFTWNALQGAQNALLKLYEYYREFQDHEGEINKPYRERFVGAINDDLDTPQALALLWQLVKDDSVEDSIKKATLLNFDSVLGLGFESIKQELIPQEVLDLVEEREAARKDEDWKKADVLREKIQQRGYEIKDTQTGPKLYPLRQ